MDDGVDDDGGGAPAAASATLSFSMRMAIPCDGRASYFLTQAQGGRWGLIDVGTVYKRAGLGDDGAGRDRQLLFHCAEDRARSADEALLLLTLLLLLLCMQVGESLQVVGSRGM